MNPIVFQAFALTATIIGYVFAASAFMRFQRLHVISPWTLLTAMFFVYLGSLSLLVFIEAVQ